jgi:hypothetical protein
MEMPDQAMPKNTPMTRMSNNPGSLVTTSVKDAEYSKNLAEK